MKSMTRRSFTAAGILAALGLTTASGASLIGCTDDYDPLDNTPETVYGPPDDFDPSNNEPVDVYGPPSDEPDPDDEDDDDDSDDYDPSGNENQLVYGPPDDFDNNAVAIDPNANLAEGLYGPPDVDPSEWSRNGAGYGSSYRPEENIQPPVYGPPA